MALRWLVARDGDADTDGETPKDLIRHRALALAGFTAFMSNTLTAYRDLVPHYPLAQPIAAGWAQSNAQVFTIGRVRFLMPDLRTFRNQTVSPATTLGDGRTTSGFASWDQKQWLLDQLSTAQSDGIKLVVLLSSSTMPGFME